MNWLGVLDPTLMDETSVATGHRLAHVARDADWAVWFAVPTMYGGFDITFRRGYVEAASRCRVVEGSAQLHVITCEGVMVADEGFV